MNSNLLNTLIAYLNDPVVLLVLAGTFFIAALVVLRRSRALIAKQHQYILSLQRDLKAITAAGVGMGQRVLELERRQRRLAERQETGGTDLYESANQPYEQAIRMAQGGAKPKELMDICGLSQSEADLISLMHRLDKAS